MESVRSAQLQVDMWIPQQDIYTDQLFWQHSLSNAITFEPPGLEHYLPSNFIIPDPPDPLPPDIPLASSSSSSDGDLDEWQRKYGQRRLYVSAGAKERAIKSQRLDGKGVRTMDSDNEEENSDKDENSRHSSNSDEEEDSQSQSASQSLSASSTTHTNASSFSPLPSIHQSQSQSQSQRTPSSSSTKSHTLGISTKGSGSATSSNGNGRRDHYGNLTKTQLVSPFQSSVPGKGFSLDNTLQRLQSLQLSTSLSQSQSFDNNNNTHNNTVSNSFYSSYSSIPSPRPTSLGTSPLYHPYHTITVTYVQNWWPKVTQ